MNNNKMAKQKAKKKKKKQVKGVINDGYTQGCGTDRERWRRLTRFPACTSRAVAELTRAHAPTRAHRRAGGDGSWKGLAAELRVKEGEEKKKKNTGGKIKN